jgi:hypothetical protein
VYTLALIFRQLHVDAVFITREGTHGEIAGYASTTLTSDISSLSHDVLMRAIDDAISRAEEGLSTDTLQEVVFGIPGSWSSQGKIAARYLAFLKSACEQLSLKPIGFLVYAEAIAHYLQKKEGAPVSAVIVEPMGTMVHISLSRAGRMVATEEIEKDDSLPAAIEGALSRLDEQILPSRIICIAQEEHKGVLNRMQTHILSHQWHPRLKFLHSPQVGILTPTQLVHAILQGTAAQLDVHLPTLALSELKIDAPEQLPSISEQMHSLHDDVKEESSPEEIVQETNEYQSPDMFGFTPESDVADAYIPEKSRSHAASIDSHADEGDADRIDSAPERVSESMRMSHAGIASLKSALRVGRKGGSALIAVGQRIPGLLSALIGSFRHGHQTSGASHTDQHDSGRQLPRGLIIGFSVLLLVIIGAFVWYATQLRASVVLHVTPTIVTEEEIVTLVTGDPRDTTQLRYEALTATLTDSVTKDATGKKDIGTQATGSVTILSRLPSSTTLAKGATLTAANGLQFTLNDAVTIASFSGGVQDDPRTVTGVAVTAKQIGKEYNLPANTRFTFSGQNNSLIGAENPTPFSGGTKNTVTVVSESDITGAQKTLIDSLSLRAQEEFSNQETDDMTILPLFISTSISNRTVSKKAGEEADSFILSASVTYTAPKIDSSVLTEFGRTLVSSRLPLDQVLLPDGIQVNMERTDSATQSATRSIRARAQVNASLIPNYDISSLQSQLAGISFVQALDVLRPLTQLKDAQIELSPPLPFLPHIMPRTPSQITITVVPAE